MNDEDKGINYFLLTVVQYVALSAMRGASPFHPSFCKYTRVCNLVVACFATLYFKIVSVVL